MYDAAAIFLVLKQEKRKSFENLVSNLFQCQNILRNEMTVWSRFKIDFWIA